MAGDGGGKAQGCRSEALRLAACCGSRRVLDSLEAVGAALAR